MRFLVVDDSSTMRRIIINTLTKLGYDKVSEAANGREGLDRLAAGADVIITDWNMPEMTGIDFIRTVRTQPATKNIPVLMVTTNAAKDDIVEALRVGVNSYVVKPFTPDSVRNPTLARAPFRSSKRQVTSSKTPRLRRRISICRSTAIRTRAS